MTLSKFFSSAALLVSLLSWPMFSYAFCSDDFPTDTKDRPNISCNWNTSITGTPLIVIQSNISSYKKTVEFSDYNSRNTALQKCIQEVSKWTIEHTTGPCDPEHVYVYRENDYFNEGGRLINWIPFLGTQSETNYAVRQIVKSISPLQNTTKKNTPSNSRDPYNSNSDYKLLPGP